MDSNQQLSKCTANETVCFDKMKTINLPQLLRRRPSLKGNGVKRSEHLPGRRDRGRVTVSRPGPGAAQPAEEGVMSILGLIESYWIPRAGGPGGHPLAPVERIIPFPKSLFTSILYFPFNPPPTIPPDFFFIALPLFKVSDSQESSMIKA